MRITESQLRRIVRRMVNEQAMGGGDVYSARGADGGTAVIDISGIPAAALPQYMDAIKQLASETYTESDTGAGGEHWSVSIQGRSLVADPAGGAFDSLRWNARSKSWSE